jgi:Ca2+-transporting ATPase
MMQDWHTVGVEEVARAFATDPHRGLSEAEAARRLAKYGPNALAERGARGRWRILAEQFRATMVVVLAVAAAVSFLLGELGDGLAILAILVLNALLGFSQEYRAERAVAALKELAVPRVRVRRDGRVWEASARDLVPGDVVLLEAGNLVPADGRLIEAHSLKTQEAVLTGESEPVEKDPTALPAADLPLGDRRNLVFMGTSVAYGRGEALVTGTGMKTELGRVARLLQAIDREPTPLQRRLDGLGRALAIVALALVAAIFALGMLRSRTCGACS